MSNSAISFKRVDGMKFLYENENIPIELVSYCWKSISIKEISKTLETP